MPRESQIERLKAEISLPRLIEASGVDHRPWLGDADEILGAIETFLTGTSARPRTRRYATGVEALSRREREVVALTVAGESAPAIAAALFLSERTVESHLARAYAKLGVHSKPELARRAAQLGLAPDSP